MLNVSISFDAKALLVVGLFPAVETYGADVPLLQELVELGELTTVPIIVTHVAWMVHWTSPAPATDRLRT